MAGPALSHDHLLKMMEEILPLPLQPQWQRHNWVQFVYPFQGLSFDVTARFTRARGVELCQIQLARGVAGAVGEDQEQDAPRERRFVNHPGSELPRELRGFNWGAFLLPGFWVLAHRHWVGFVWWGLTLCSLISPPFCVLLFCLQIAFGVRGSQWAWEKRQWQSTYEFEEVQRIWKTWGVALLLIPFILSSVAVALKSLR